MNHIHYLVAFFFCWVFFWGCYSYFGIACCYYFNFFNLFIVTLAVVATLVANSYAPPANVILHPLHFQIPHDTLFTAVYISQLNTFPHGGQTYLACCWSSNFLRIFLIAEPYLVPYFPTIPTFLVLLAINLFNIIKSTLN